MLNCDNILSLILVLSVLLCVCHCGEDNKTNIGLCSMNFCYTSSTSERTKWKFIIAVIIVGSMLLLLIYHRLLRMILEALQLRLEGGRFSHSLCVCV